MRDPLVPAAVLVAGGIELVVVGSAALVVYGEVSEANDLDIVPSYNGPNLARLHSELAKITQTSRRIGPLVGRDVARVVTSFGVIDVLLERGALEFDALTTEARTADVHGVQVPIASCSDAWRLRRRFKMAS